jgi:two-component system, response regulator / RNA-binding antiterminator
MLTILLVGEFGSRLDNLAELLTQAGHTIERIPSTRLLQLDTLIDVLQPHLVLIDYSDPMRDSVEQFCITPYDADSPLLVLAQSLDPDLSHRLRQSGLAVYTGISTEIAQVMSLMPVLDVLTARERKLRDQVDELQQELQDRRDIERAKDFLSRTMSCTGEQAYQAMRQKSMQKRCTLGEIARTILKQSKHS